MLQARERVRGIRLCERGHPPGADRRPEQSNVRHGRQPLAHEVTIERDQPEALGPAGRRGHANVARSDPFGADSRAHQVLHAIRASGHRSCAPLARHVVESGHAPSSPNRVTTPESTDARALRHSEA
jgi:hypothetical protein